MKGREIHWVTFDCYGTLIDWNAAVRQFLSNLFIKKGVEGVNVDKARDLWEEIQFELIQGPYRPYRQILPISLQKTFCLLGLPYNDEDGLAFVESLKSWSAFDDVKPSLMKIRGIVPIAIISNIDRDLLHQSVLQMDVTFDDLITAEDAGCYKPNEEIFRFAIQRLDTPADQILHVAFGYRYDLGPARKVGMRTCWLNRGAERLPEGFLADFTAGRLDEVVRIVEALAGR
ncbi:MAG: HAD-IA family hydrolase [Armatimonadetes bacterium]|nr:HAD-IA family hydrolase [Armatimonadota bacterium]MDW8121208.1 HAD-IA family hydrolase [Armatimonadota bacterium]